MNLLLVTFSLRNQLKDYDSFFVTLRGNASQWCHYIEQTFLVRTPYDVQEFCNRLYPHMEKTDSLLVVKMDGAQRQGWLPQEAWDWMNQVQPPKPPAAPQILSPVKPLLPPPPKR